MDRTPLLRWTPIGDGILPLAGSMIAFVLMLLVIGL